MHSTVSTADTVDGVDAGNRAGTGSTLGRAAAGDQQAWQEMVAQYRGLLRSIASEFRMSPGDADDAAQMTWLGLVQNVDKLRVPEAVVGWLATTMRRNCSRVQRQRWREHLRDDWMQWQVEDDTVAVDADVIVAERDRVLWEIVDRLPDRQRKLVRLMFAVKEPSYLEIAETMSMAVGTIGPARQRALRNLEKLLAEPGPGRTGLGELFGRVPAAPALRSGSMSHQR
jgi:RNA polymerase sigma factor (sigma-70 family)